jgi:hypothetical protein
MVFNTTFNNISAISWQSVLLVEETGVPRENHWPVASHWQSLSHNVASSIPCNHSVISLHQALIVTKWIPHFWDTGLLVHVLIFFLLGQWQSSQKAQYTWNLPFFIRSTMARTSSMRWCLFCTRPTLFVGVLIVLAHWNKIKG